MSSVISAGEMVGLVLEEPGIPKDEQNAGNRDRVVDLR